MLESQERSFKHINNWTSESIKKFANRLAIILAITEDLRHKYKSNSSKSVGYDVECDPIRIHCLNKRGEWIGISNCLSYRKSTLDIFANEDWDDLHRDRGCPTFYPLHDLESHWRYPIFRGGLHFEPLDINELQLHVTVRRQAFFPFSPHSEYSVFLNQLLEAEHCKRSMITTFK
ncbi:hypothetical protein BIT28_14155 [Photobacterium proteolyticum]|uniref:Uncharacterized protein n=1 Tax=Photobacterium proteolyticum TaxID=1903952 RepID=A0A1Q9H7C9_9GAMM|nr:hypothetical protein BIT28_14155 [Photobacterium proteolyticum]